MIEKTLNNHLAWPSSMTLPVSLLHKFGKTMSAKQGNMFITLIKTKRLPIKLMQHYQNAVGLNAPLITNKDAHKSFRILIFVEEDVDCVCQKNFFISKFSFACCTNSVKTGSHLKRHFSPFLKSQIPFSCN